MDWYNFKEIIKLINEEATRANLNIKLKELRAKLTEKDNLLIYYSGHGQKSENIEKAYWIPVNAKETFDENEYTYKGFCVYGAQAIIQLN